MTFGSLFSGVGGLDLGLELAGMECRWQCEIDPFCTKVLEKHWPNVKRYGDITKIEGSELEWVDLICGGFPCQDISLQGAKWTKRLGIGGDRSGLWREMLRIVCMVRPRVLLVENVPAMLGNGMGVVLGGLAEAGYDAEWDCIPSSAFGAAHQRDRLFVVAYDVRERIQGGGKKEVFGISPLSGIEDIRRLEDLRGRTDLLSSALCRSINGIPFGVDRIKSLGNAVVPQVGEWIGRRILEADL